jgi:hypothetical protein
MSWGRLLIVVLAGIGACAHPSSARAQAFRSIDQVPGMIDQDAEKVIIANIGTSALSLSYLDGVWKTIQIPSGQYVTLPGQGSGLSVTFNDGAAVQSVTLNRGTTYALHWNSGLNRWAMGLYDDVARRPSGLRSR